MFSSSLFAVFVFSFAVGFGAVISPGPVSVAIVTQSPRHGWTVGPLVAFGHSILELIIVLLIAFGLSKGLATPIIQVAIAVLGGLFLLWMGLNMLLGVKQGKYRLSGASDTLGEMNSIKFVSLGIIATMSNPFWYAWWVTVAAGYLSQLQGLGGPAIAAFYFGHISADFAWDTTLSAIIGSGRKWITEKVYSTIISVSGIFFISLGFVFLNHAIAIAN